MVPAPNMAIFSVELAIGFLFRVARYSVITFVIELYLNHPIYHEGHEGNEGSDDQNSELRALRAFVVNLRSQSTR
jgi:hypothetical protein